MLRGVPRNESWDGISTARVVFSFAPSREKKEERVQLLTQQKLHEKIQEIRDYQSWRHSECGLKTLFTIPSDIYAMFYFFTCLKYKFNLYNLKHILHLSLI